MKKAILLFAAVAMIYTTARSQEQVFSKGTSAVNIGIGFGSTIYHGGYYSMGFPTISGSYELGIVEVPMGSQLTGVVSVGGLLGFGGSKYDYSYGLYGYDVKTNYFLLAARGNYHFVFHDKFDPYAGVIMGYYFANHKVTYGPGYPSNLPAYDEGTGGFHAGAYAGARWYFTPAFAAFAEVGWNISVLTIGATLKF